MSLVVIIYLWQLSDLAHWGLYDANIDRSPAPHTMKWYMNVYVDNLPTKRSMSLFNRSNWGFEEVPTMCSMRLWEAAVWCGWKWIYDTRWIANLILSIVKIAWWKDIVYICGMQYTWINYDKYYGKIMWNILAHDVKWHGSQRSIISDTFSLSRGFDASECMKLLRQNDLCTMHWLSCSRQFRTNGVESLFPVPFCRNTQKYHRNITEIH